MHICVPHLREPHSPVQMVETMPGLHTLSTLCRAGLTAAVTRTEMTQVWGLLICTYFRTCEPGCSLLDI